MKRRFMPQELYAPWWQRYGAAVEVEFNLFPASRPVREWAFSYEGAFVRRYGGFEVFWLRGWVCILGLRLGAGVFRRSNRRFEQQSYAASVDTHPKDGDAKQAPLVSGAVGEAETPKGGSHA